jgi:ABC-type amino acid transport substrate-binding protein
MPCFSVTRLLQVGAITLVASLLIAGTAVAAPLETIKPNTLIVAFNGDMPGTSWEAGKLVGIDGEILQWVADELHLKIEPALMEFSAEIGSVQTRRADIFVGMVSWRSQRAEILTLTDPIYYAQAMFVQKKDHNWNTIKDLEGKIVASIQGFGQAREVKEVKGTDLKLYDTTDAAIRDLLAGRVQVLFADPPLVTYALKQNPGWPLHAVPAKREPDPRYPLLSGGKYEIVMGLSKEAPALAAAINQKIDQAWTDCMINKIAAKYGLSDATWFEPAEQDTRVGVDRPTGWQPPRAAAVCK